MSLGRNDYGHELLRKDRLPVTSSPAYSIVKCSTVDDGVLVKWNVAALEGD